MTIQQKWADFKGGSASYINGLLSKENESVDKLLGIHPPTLDKYTYESVIKHITEIRFKDEEVKQAAVLRQPYPLDSQLTHLVIMCLDKNSKPFPYSKGMSYTVEFLIQSVDEELTEALDESNNILYFHLN